MMTTSVLVFKLDLDPGRGMCVHVLLGPRLPMPNTMLMFHSYLKGSNLDDSRRAHVSIGTQPPDDKSHARVSLGSQPVMKNAMLGFTRTSTLMTCAKLAFQFDLDP